MGALGCVCVCVCMNVCAIQLVCVYVHTNIRGLCVCVCVCTGRWGLRALSRILDKVGALPKDGWMEEFHIVKNTNIPPRSQVCAGFFFLGGDFLLLDESR